MLQLQLFGGCALLADGELLTGPAVQRRRLALLALLALSDETGVSRDKLIGYFWPEEDRENARHLLSDSLSTIRKAIGKDAVLAAGEDVRLNVETIGSDVARFEELVDTGGLKEAVSLYRGPLLDGFFVSNAPEFERRVDEERDRLARHYAHCLEQLAESAEANEDWAAATEWWKRLAAHDPYSSRVALRVMRALDATGDTAAALQHASRHEKIVRETLELAPDADVIAFSEKLRRRPSTAARNTTAPVGTTVSSKLPPNRSEQTSVPSNGSSVRSRVYRSPVGWTILVASVAIVFAAIRVLPHQRVASVADSGLPRIPISKASPGRKTPLTARDEARDLYSQGRYYVTRLESPGFASQQSLKAALDFFQRAAQRDPSFAPAYAGMADLYSQSNEPEHARETALKALALDSSLAESHTALAYVLAWYDHRWSAADSELQRAIELDPRYVRAWLRRAYVLAALNRPDEAMRAVNHARELDPESWFVLYNQGLVASDAGRNDEAVSHLQAALVLEPTRKDVKANLAMAYWMEDRFAEATAMFGSIGASAIAAAASGDLKEMARTARLFEMDSVELPPNVAALLYVKLGQRQKAFDQLDLAVKTQRSFPVKLRVPPLSTLRGDPRYTKLLARLNLR